MPLNENSRLWLELKSLSTSELSSELVSTRATKKPSWKNKTHKTLTRKNLLGITLPVAKVTAFETSEGTANRVVTLWERAKTERFVVAMTPVAEAERLARERSKDFS